MPIRWSAIKVSQSLDEIEEIVKEAEPIFQKAREKAKEACQVPNLPEYMSQPIGGLEWGLKEDLLRIYSDIKRIRKYIPEEALAREQKRFDQWLDLFGDEEKAKEAMATFK